MSNIKLSVIIPCWGDPYLQKTIDALLNGSHLGDQLEIIPVLDGYWPDKPIADDDRVRVLHLGKNVGPRSCVNAGIRIARGEFVMRSDAHCDFGKGFDKILTDTCEPNWIIAGIRYFLDPTTWTLMDKEKVIYEKLVIQSIEDRKKFTGYPWRERDKERKDIVIDETMSVQGSVWVMRRSWWDKVIGELNNKYGPHYQDQHEMIFKTWKNGGKMMINKNTWYAHRHNKFAQGTHRITHSSQKENLQRFYDDWKDYYYNEIKPKWGI